MTLPKSSKTTTCITPATKSRTQEADLEKRTLIWKYLSYKLKKKQLKGNKEDQRGVELKYSWIGRHTGLTYKQVRGLMDRMVRAGIIEKWTQYTSYRTQRNFYRLTQQE